MREGRRQCAYVRATQSPTLSGAPGDSLAGEPKIVCCVAEVAILE